MELESNNVVGPPEEVAALSSQGEVAVQRSATVLLGRLVIQIDDKVRNNGAPEFGTGTTCESSDFA